MAENDHLDNDVAIFGELTPSGVKGGARSRAVSSIDRLIGSVVDALSAPLEGFAKRERARQQTQTELIAALGEKQLQHLHENPDFADHALRQHLKVTVSRETNKAETVKLAIEDLRNSPPTEEQSATGPETLDPDFLNRFERYAEDASTDQVRERWGRVLASEIRAPGTFSAKVLRIVDELDPTTALLFERFCRQRLGNTVIGCLSDPLEFLEQKRLITAGLMVDPGSGALRTATSLQLTNGRDVDVISMDVAAIAVPTGSAISQPGAALNKSLMISDGKAGVPVYVLTDEGHAISSILAHDEEACFSRYLQRLRSDFPDLEIMEMRHQISNKSWIVVNTWNPKPANAVAVEPES